MDKNQTLVFVSLEDWDEIWRRNQFVCRELTQRGWEILFVEPAADWSAGLRLREWEQFSRRPMWSPQGMPGIRVVRPVKLLPKSHDWGEALNRRLWMKCVVGVLRRLNWVKPALWVNNQLLWPVAAQREHWAHVLYDVTDDWSTAGGTEAWLAQVRRDDAAMADVADEIVVCSDALAQARQERWGQKLTLVANGVDLAHFEKVDTSTVAADLMALPDAELRLCYSGTAHPDRLDVDLIAAIAGARPQWSWVFIGPNHMGEADQLKLAMPNITFLGPRPYADLPSYLAGVDVCVTPHRVTAFTESLNPIKLWEYLAVGHPIVSTQVAGFRDFPQEVALAGDAPAWIAAIEAMLQTTDEDKQKAKDHRRKQVRDHGWTARTEVLESRLRYNESVEDGKQVG